MIDVFRQRFWAKVKKSKHCWLWTASTSSGYGTFRYKGKMLVAHRVSYLFALGRLPRKLYVLHRCDNKLCVNPKHLWLGTQLDNMHDMLRKGRRPKRTNNKSQIGTLNNGAKLNSAIVKRVKRLFRQRTPQAEIARLTGATRANVWAIVHEVSWTHIK